MSFRKSIRWRIQAWHGGLLFAVIAGFCVTAYRLEKADALRRADQELNLRLGVLAETLTHGQPGKGRPPDGEPPDEDGSPEPDEEPREGRPPPPGFRSSEVAALFSPAGPDPFYYRIWSRTGSEIDRSTTGPVEIPLPSSTGVKSMDHQMRERAGFRERYHFTPPGECLLVGRSTAEMDREMRDLAWKLGVVGTGVLLAGLAGGAWISARALRPIADISAAATRIAAGHLKERIRTTETESELGRLAGLLDDTFQRLDEAFDEQARFTSDAAHELRTPVSIILAQSQLALARERSAQEYRDTIETAQRAAQRMHSLIESLLKLAILDHADGALQRERCDLSEIAADQVSQFAPLAAEKGIILNSQLTGALCPADAGQIAQIIGNLLTNAIKFSPSGASVTVSTGGDSGAVELVVHDTGPGISAEHLPHLFDRFYRTDSSRNRSSGGAGLGLAICKRIAEAHGGTLTVDSLPGQGTRFTLSIPRGKD